MDFLKSKRFFVILILLLAVGIVILMPKTQSPVEEVLEPTTENPANRPQSSIENPQPPQTTDSQRSVPDPTPKKTGEILDPQNPKFKDGIGQYLATLPPNLKKRAQVVVHQRSANKVWAHLKIDDAKVYLSEARFKEEPNGSLRFENGKLPEIQATLPPFPKTSPETHLDSVKNEIQSSGSLAVEINPKGKIWEKTTGQGFQPRFEFTAKVQDSPNGFAHSEILWINPQTGKIEKRIKAARK